MKDGRDVNEETVKLMDARTRKEMTWTKLKAHRSEMDRGYIDGKDVTNFPKILEWMTTTESRELWEQRIRLTGDNRKNFRDIFGKPSFCWKGEFYFHCWLLEVPGAKLLLLTAKEKGTCYDLLIGHERKVIEFLDWLCHKLPERT
jgi:hypothetical protein